MSSKRLDAASKRRRQVFVKKMMLGIVLCVMLLSFSVCFKGGLVDAHGDQKEAPMSYKYYKSIEIQGGDTLWDIAKEYMSDDYASVYDYIEELKSVNGLTSDDIQEGHYLTVVYYDTEFK